MGYTTTFTGEVTVEPALNAAEIAFLTEFAETRRMARTNGPLFADGGTDGFGQDNAPDVTNYNRPPADQPGLWCQWIPTNDGTQIAWDEGEKFYNAAEWMKYIVENLLAPSARAYIDKHLGEDERLAGFTCDHVVNGEIEAQGEDNGDRWMLVVKDNAVAVAEVEINYANPRSI